mgnify:CR=1 FL=1
MEQKGDSIVISSNKISTLFTILMIDHKGVVSAYVPSFNLHFSAPDKSEVEKIGRFMVRSFFNLWLDQANRKVLAKQLVKLGFREENDFETKQAVLGEKSGELNFNSKQRQSPHSFDEIAEELIAEESLIF